MPLVVWKYEIPVADEFTLDLPLGAQLLTVQVQPMLSGVMLWALVDPAQPRCQRFFRLADTGHSIHAEQDTLRFIGTYQLDNGSLVSHLFELVNK